MDLHLFFIHGGYGGLHEAAGAVASVPRCRMTQTGGSGWPGMGQAIIDNAVRPPVRLSNSGCVQPEMTDWPDIRVLRKILCRALSG